MQLANIESIYNAIVLLSDIERENYEERFLPKQ